MLHVGLGFVLFFILEKSNLELKDIKIESL